MQLALGTVQFGLDYGISNLRGMTPIGEVRRILECASSNGIELIDTASVYGDSETVLGQLLQNESHFKIITKSPPIGKVPLGDFEIAVLRQTFEASLEKLGRRKIYGFLVHHAQDLLVPGGNRLYEYMLQLKDSQIVSKIGVSIYPRDDVRHIVSSYPIDIVQLPVNILDQRLWSDGTIDYLKSRQIEIHARSLFLQGLLLMRLDEIPSFLAAAIPALRRYHGFLNDSNLSPLDGAYCFARSIPQIDVIVVGVNDRTQLIQNIKSFQKSQNNSIQTAFSEYALHDESILNPSYWRQ